MVTGSVKNQTKGSVLAGGLHKSSGSAVSSVEKYNIMLDPEEDRFWLVALLKHPKYAVRCCEHYEQTYADHSCKCFVPSVEELHVYPNRTKRKVMKTVFPRMVFVSGISEQQAYVSVPSCEYIDIFMPDRAKMRINGRLALATISQLDMVKLQRVIQGVCSPEDVTFTTDSLKFDQQIEVVNGTLQGLEGGYYCAEGKDYLVFMLGRLGNIKVRVSIGNCKLKKG